MRTRALLVGLIAISALLAGVGSSAASERGPVGSLVIDGTTSDGYDVKAAVAQRGDPFSARGYVDTRFVVGGGVFDMAGPATCLDVRGRTAGAIFRVEKPANSVFIGTMVYGSFVDSGPGRADRFAALTLPAGTRLPGCAPRADVTLQPFVRGGLTVTGGTATSSSR